MNAKRKAAKAFNERYIKEQERLGSMTSDEVQNEIVTLAVNNALSTLKPHFDNMNKPNN